ncbi:hypothetical protein L1987_61565 [Smallanthus sonchifolius]|uniref:Uncharacterized protein n=1 Tax=Smallanthus sonchifolius TaxID=185202 RepID=A0ACB9C833_9ASTR|nr:hypothetical protein L1987_61565 [Smallanthus sonchifolius]
MVKRLTTQPSLKISKKQPTHQFNNLIKVLKPKVFITTSSNFKTLVQELTGNGSQTAVPPTTMHGVSSEPTHVIHLDDHYDSPGPSLDYSLDPSLDHSLDCSPDPSFDCSLDPSLGCSPDPSLDDMFTPFDCSNGSSEELGLQFPEDLVMDYVNHEIELANIESWLLDIDPPACIRDEPFMPMNTYEYDYNLPFIM